MSILAIWQFFRLVLNKWNHEDPCFPKSFAWIKLRIHRGHREYHQPRECPPFTRCPRFVCSVICQMSWFPIGTTSHNEHCWGQKWTFLKVKIPFDLFVYLAKSCSQFATKLAGLPTKYSSSLLLVLLEVIRTVAWPKCTQSLKRRKFLTDLLGDFGQIIWKVFERFFEQIFFERFFDRFFWKILWTDFLEDFLTDCLKVFLDEFLDRFVDRF